MNNYLVVHCDRAILREQLEEKLDPKVWQIVSVTNSAGMFTIIAQRIVPRQQNLEIHANAVDSEDMDLSDRIR